MSHVHDDLIRQLVCDFIDRGGDGGRVLYRLERARRGPKGGLVWRDFAYVWASNRDQAVEFGARAIRGLAMFRAKEMLRV